MTLPLGTILTLLLTFTAAGRALLAAEPALPSLVLSESRGFFDRPFSLTLAAPRPGAKIRYTLEGSPPTSTNGMEYSVPLAITNTTILRAAAFQDTNRVSAVATHTYIFPDQILRQPHNPPGFPSGRRAWNGFPSIYGMHPGVVNDPAYRDRIKPALLALPTLSVVCPRGDLFDAGAGLYVNSAQHGDAWERACSAELILPENRGGFQVDCGLRVQGNSNRLPHKSPKHSFRLVFKERYGAGKLRYPVFPDSPLDRFDTLVLRADYNNSWIHWDPAARPRAQRTRDAWMKDSHRALGGLAGHNRFVHLYLDGLYWGIYDLAERPDANFAAAYLGGAQANYDVINESQAKDGTIDAFQTMMSWQDLSDPAQYARLGQWIDVPAFIDYLLLNYYVGNQDVGELKNWYAIRRRAPGARFVYLVWDGEQMLHDVDDDTIRRPYEAPFRLAQDLMANAEYRLAFADRAQKHLFGDGALTPGSCASRWMNRARQVDVAVIAESARWGYYRQDRPYTRDQEWLTEQRRLIETYFPQRTGILLGQLRATGLYPRVAAPALRWDGQDITLTAPASVSVYFTTNGSDPRVPIKGEVARDAQPFTRAVKVLPATVIRARAKQGTEWSALVEASSTNALVSGRP